MLAETRACRRADLQARGLAGARARRRADLHARQRAGALTCRCAGARARRRADSWTGSSWYSTHQRRRRYGWSRAADGPGKRWRHRRSRLDNVQLEVNALAVAIVVTNTTELAKEYEMLFLYVINGKLLE